MLIPAILLTALATPTELEAPRPNIVLVLADDLGWGDPGFMNPESAIPTPRMDALAAEGLAFLDAHAPAAVCSPTRYGILTGRYAFRGKLKRGVVLPYDPPILESERLTLPELLGQAGYHTSIVGKWHLGWDWPRAKNNPRALDLSRPIAGGPLDHGFDEYYGQDVPHFPPYGWIEGNRIEAELTEWTPQEFFGNPGPMEPGFDQMEILPRIATRAVETIRRRAEEEEPFFLFVSLTSPHTPIAPTEPFQGKSEAGPYGDFVCQTDAVLGQILDALEEQEIVDETLVIFASDNGSPERIDTWSDVGTIPDRYEHAANGPWRGIKADVWEAGHRVPLVVRWPGRVAAGEKSDEPVCLIDWMGTLASILELELPDDSAEDSFDISPVLFGETFEGSVRGPIFHQTFHGMIGMRDGDWKLVFGRGSGGWSEPVWIEPVEGEPFGQLYHLGRDPGETRNLYAEEAERTKELEELARSLVMAGRTRPPVEDED